MVVLVAIVFKPHDFAIAAIALVDRPGAREGIIDDRDDVMHEVGVVLVEGDPLLDDGLIVLMQGDSAELDRARALEVASLDFERVVTAVAVGIEPLADRIARKARLFVVGEVTSVGIDAAGHEGLEMNICDLRQNYELNRL